MKKSILSLFLVALIIMVSFLSFEASALTAYGQPCAADSDCASNKCRTVIDTTKECGCRLNSDCPSGQGCEASSNMCKTAYDRACTAPTQCASGVCGNSAGSGRCGCSSDANCGPTQACNTASRDCKIRNGAACNPAYPALCASGYCNPTTRVCESRFTRREQEMVPSGLSAGGGGANPETECSSGFTCVSGRCEGQKVNNAACTRPAECSSGICTGGKCKTVCMKTADCANGKICDLNTGTCIAPRSKANNAASFQNDACRSGSSYNGKCRACSSNSDCTTFAGAGSTGILGGTCVSGVCQPLLENRAECYTPDQCKSGICAAITGTTKKCGTVCSKDEHCGGNKICDLNTGTCIASRSKAVDAACFQNEVCRSSLCYNGKCKASCGAAAADDSTPTGGGGVAEGARCSTNAECASGQTCAAATWSHSPTGLKDNGAECSSYTECKSGTCVARSSAKGTCAECRGEGVQRCGRAGAACTAAGVCKANTNARCYDDVNCNSGFCSRFPKDTKSGICSTRCRSDSDCTAGNKCNINSGVCERGSCQARFARREQEMVPSGLPPGGDGGCAGLSGVDRVKCEIDSLITNMKARVAGI